MRRFTFAVTLIDMTHGAKAHDDEPIEEPTATDASGFRRAQATLNDCDRSSVTSLPPSARDRAVLTVLNGPARGVIVALDSNSVTIGRSADYSSVVIPEPSLSRAHAQIRCMQWPGGNQFFIEDLGSTNGTFVNRNRVTRTTLLTDGARIALGRRTFLRFSIQDRLEQEALIRVHESALHDALTGVSNRSVFEERMQSELAYAKRHKCRVTLIMVDVDHFKGFNDQHGHQAGDAALRFVAKRMKACLRPEDLLARYGGEEFVIVLRDASIVEASELVESVRLAIAEQPFVWGEQSLSVTASFGMAHYDGYGELVSGDLVAVADAALYRAKRAGRNRSIDAGIVGTDAG